MSIGIGSKSRLAFVVETAYGVFPATPTGQQIGFNSESIQNSRNTFTSQEINPNRQVTAVRSGNVSAGGEISTEWSPNVLGVFLKHLLCVAPVTTSITPVTMTNSLACTRGTYYTSSARVYLCTRAGTSSASATTSMVSVDPNEEFLEGTAYFQFYAVSAGLALYQHVFAAAVAKPVGGFSVQREVFLDTGSQFFRYIGGRINTWSLNVPQEGIVTCSFGFLFLDLDTVAGTTIWSSLTNPLDDPFAGSQTVIRTKAPGGSYTEDYSLSTASLSLTNNYDTNPYTVGQKRRRDLPEGTRTITGSFGAFFEDLTKFNFFKNESIIGLEISSNNAGMYAQVEMPTIKLTGGSPAPVISGQGTVSSSFDWQAFTNGTNDIIVTLKNSTASYP